MQKGNYYQKSKRPFKPPKPEGWGEGVEIWFEGKEPVKVNDAPKPKRRHTHKIVCPNPLCKEVLINRKCRIKGCKPSNSEALHLGEKPWEKIEEGYTEGTCLKCGEKFLYKLGIVGRFDIFGVT